MPTADKANKLQWWTFETVDWNHNRCTAHIGYTNKANYLNSDLGTGIRGLMRGIAALPQGYQELLVVRDKVGRPQVSKQVHGM